MRKCTGCGWIEDKPLGLNAKGEPYLGCCPDSNYKELTAMQELIEEFEIIKTTKCKTLQEMIFFDGILAIIESKYLEKEKEQIVNAFEVGYKSCDIDEAFEINRKLASGEQHYNKTYNLC